jgi:hypothetical protein
MSPLPGKSGGVPISDISLFLKNGMAFFAPMRGKAIFENIYVKFET